VVRGQEIPLPDGGEEIGKSQKWSGRAGERSLGKRESCGGGGTIVQCGHHQRTK
jgi:hypothetical protein